jgi:hypothetical protein
MERSLNRNEIGCRRLNGRSKEKYPRKQPSDKYVYYAEKAKSQKVAVIASSTTSDDDSANPKKFKYDIDAMLEGDMEDEETESEIDRFISLRRV